MKVYLNYVRLLAIGIFVFIMLEQQYGIYSQIGPVSKTIVKGKDFISLKDQSFSAIRDILPPKGIYRFQTDSCSGYGEFSMYYYTAQYSVAPRVLTDSLYTDTVICNFFRTITINNPQNPLYATRSQWTVLNDNGTGVMLLKKSK